MMFPETRFRQPIYDGINVVPISNVEDKTLPKIRLCSPPKEWNWLMRHTDYIAESLHFLEGFRNGGNHTRLLRLWPIKHSASAMWTGFNPPLRGAKPIERESDGQTSPVHASHCFCNWIGEGNYSQDPTHETSNSQSLKCCRGTTGLIQGGTFFLNTTPSSQ